MNIQIVFESEAFIVADKEAMVLTTPARTGLADARTCLGTALQEQKGQQIFPVHRLDYEVSGLVIFAKTAKAHALANGWFEKKSVFKTYQALTSRSAGAESPHGVAVMRGELPSVGEKLLWKSLLLRGKKRAYEHATGKPSETIATYEGFEEFSQAHRWTLHPLTGRPHQLRYELYRHGFPILGDTLYGSDVAFSGSGIALRAIEIDFQKAPQAKELGLPGVVKARSLF